MKNPFLLFVSSRFIYFFFFFTFFGVCFWGTQFLFRRMFLFCPTYFINNEKKERKKKSPKGLGIIPGASCLLVFTADTPEKYGLICSFLPVTPISYLSFFLFNEQFSCSLFYIYTTLLHLFPAALYLSIFIFFFIEAEF